MTDKTVLRRRLKTGSAEVISAVLSTLYTQDRLDIGTTLFHGLWLWFCAPNTFKGVSFLKLNRNSFEPIQTSTWEVWCNTGARTFQLQCYCGFGRRVAHEQDSKSFSFKLARRQTPGSPVLPWVWQGPWSRLAADTRAEMRVPLPYLWARQWIAVENRRILYELVMAKPRLAFLSHSLCFTCYLQCRKYVNIGNPWSRFTLTLANSCATYVSILRLGGCRV